MIMDRKRKAHVIKRAKSDTMPKYVIYYDTETIPTKTKNGEEHHFRLGVAAYVRYTKGEYVNAPAKWLEFNDTRVFWRWVSDHVTYHSRIYVIAHNLDFDFTTSDTLRALTELRYKIKFFAVSGSIFTWEFSKDTKTIVLLDSTQFLRGSIAGLGKLINLPKMKMPLYQESDAVWYPYCKRDVEVLKLAMENYMQFVYDNHLGSFAITVASQAMHAFKHNFMTHNIYVHGNNELDEFERESYHGGRTEAFYIGELKGGKIYDLDVNSMYPYVMHSYRYPVKHLSSVPDPTVDDIKATLKRFSLVSDVDLEVREPVFPVNRSKLIFPIGRFRSTLTTPELEYALDHDYIKRVHRLEIYANAPIFVDYVDFFYALKQKYKKLDQPILYKVAKLFQNSLYGKFGQRVGSSELIDTRSPLEYGIERILSPESNSIEYHVIIAGNVYRYQSREPSFDSFIAIASHVTAYARMYLWELISQAGINHVYYCDTDSLFVDEVGRVRLEKYMDDYELGKLKIEKEFEWLTIHGAKDYENDKDVKIKGIPYRSEKISTNIYQYDHFSRFRSNLDSGKINTVTVSKVTKILSREYTKGIITASGRVEPFYLNEF